MTGTMWHRFLGDMLVGSGAAYMQEVNVTPGLPEGWSGTADAVFWDQECGGFVLADFKTIKGEGMKWVLKEGAKEEHIWQGSAYWHALYDMRLPLVKGFAVWYLPQNDTTERDELIEPTLMECDPLPRDLVFGVMEDRWQACQEYLNERIDGLTVQQRHMVSGHDDAPTDLTWIFHTDKLAPEMSRVQKVYWNGKQSVFDVKLVPHWSSQFCPYPTELCACSEQGSNKIGHYAYVDGDWHYEPRKDYEDELPMVEPSNTDKRKRARELDANSKSDETRVSTGGATEGATGDAGPSEERDQPALR